MTYGRKRISVNFGFVFVNLCKLFMQKWSVLHFGTDHLRKLLFSPSLFFDYSDVYFDKIASIIDLVVISIFVYLNIGK